MRYRLLATIVAVVVFATSMMSISDAQSTTCDWQPYGNTIYEVTSSACVPTELAVYVREKLQPTPDPTPVPPTPTPTPDPDPTPDPTPDPDPTPVPPTPTPAPPTPTPVPPTPTPNPTPNPSGTFIETFDTPASLDRFQFAVHHAWVWGATDQTWVGDHDLNCGGADTSRIVRNPTAIDGTIYYEGLTDQVIYWCRQHMMTSINTNHYAQIDFSPAQSFSSVSRVCWDQNLTDVGNRKWTQMAVISESRYQANGGRLDYVVPRLEGGPGAAGVFMRGDDFIFEYNQGATIAHTGRSSSSQNNPQFTTRDKMTRYTTCVEDIGGNRIRVEIDKPGGSEVRTLTGSFPDGPARVIFQDDNYNPDKSIPRSTVPNPYTWHWDNIIVEQ